LKFISYFDHVLVIPIESAQQSPVNERFIMNFELCTQMLLRSMISTPATTVV